MGAQPAVFLDRDGTLIEDRDYLSDPSGVRLLPGAAEAVERLRRSGYRVVLVTNQSGIGRGYFTEEDYARVHRELRRQLAVAGTELDGSYHCPDAPPAGPGDETCRKPAPVLYRRAEGELGLDLRRSWFVGDKASDVAAARVFGGSGVLVRTGYGESERSKVFRSCAVVEDLAAAARLICSTKGVEPPR